MAIIQLRNIIGKRNTASAAVLSFMENLSSGFSIEDVNGKLLHGNDVIEDAERFPVTAENEIIGWVKGNGTAARVAEFLSLLSEKEAEKKKLGNEVLNLYKEINQVFNFSEKLAQTLGPAAIAQITLDEARHVIEHDQSVIVLWNESNRKLEVVASRGGLFFDEAIISSRIEVLLKIILGGQSEILNDTSQLVEQGIISADTGSIVYAALKVKHRVMGAVILASRTAGYYRASDLKLLVTFALQCSSAIESALLYERTIREANEREEAMRVVYKAAEKFVPHAFIGSLGHKFITDVKLGDQVEKVVTVLFTDIREFATLSERMTPEANFAFICAFNERMGPIIRSHNGFINQYLGDAIMAIFPGNASDALAAAIDMQNAVTALNNQRYEKDYPTIQIGIGMHTGPLIMGITGDDERLDAATISDTVNTASRIESLTKYFKTNILITEATASQIETGNETLLRPLGRVQVKGKREPISIFDCIGKSGEEEFQRKEATLALFNEGILQYQKKSFARAFISFQQVLEQDASDKTANLFLAKSARYISSGVPEDWTGVEQMSEK